MKLVFIKIAAFISLIVALSVLAAAGPAAMDSLQMLSAGSMNDLIGGLSHRTDAESYHMLSRAYYAIEQWDAAIQNGERAAVKPARGAIRNIIYGWVALTGRRRLRLEIP